MTEDVPVGKEVSFVFLKKCFGAIVCIHLNFLVHHASSSLALTRTIRIVFIQRKSWLERFTVGNIEMTTSVPSQMDVPRTSTN